MTTLYHSDPSTGQIYETIEAKTKAEQEFLMSADGGMWFETPRWHRNPKPHGYDPSNPYESPVSTPYVELPRVLYKQDGTITIKATVEGEKDIKQPRWMTLLVKTREEKIDALKKGYLLVPDKEQHEALALTDRECQEAAAK